MDQLESQFQEEMLQIYRESLKIGYKPLLFLQMIGVLGGVNAAKKLLATNETSNGFTRLWELGRLDLTVEAVVIKEEYAELFDVKEIEIARSRLENVGFFKKAK